MKCKQVITHMVREGDSFYSIAQYYQIPVEIIIEQNPGLDPYNLQIGTTLVICMDDMPGGQDSGRDFDWQKVLNVSNAMRKVWSQHVYWTQMLLTSIAGRLPDQMAVTRRVLENPGDIAGVFEEFYPKELTDTIARLLTEHLQMGSALMTALRDGRTAEASGLISQWYENADQIAEALAGMNPHYRLEEVKQMFYHHLGMLQQVMAAQLAGNYEGAIQVLDQMEEDALQKADYLSSGLVMQFPQRF